MSTHRIPKVGKRIYAPLTEPAAGALVDLYVRYSSDNQSGESIETQLVKLRDYAHKKGWVIRKEWEDAGQSAKYEDIAHRPLFAECLNAVKAQQMEAVLCLKMDRWSRNQSVLYETFNICMEHHVWWVAVYGEQTLNKQMDPAGGRFLIAIEAAQSEGFLAYLSREVVDGLRTRGEQGYHRGAASFGYEVVYPPRPQGAPANWQPPRTAMTPKYPDFTAVQRIGDYVADGISDGHSADLLNEHGYLFTPSTNKRTGPLNRRTGVSQKAQSHLFTKETVRWIRRNPIYRAFAPDSDRGTILLARDNGDVERIQGVHVAAWDWDLCQRMDITAKRKGDRKRTLATTFHLYPLASIIVCAACGEAMRVQHKGKRQHTHINDQFYYRCSTHIRRLPCSATAISAHCDEVHKVMSMWLMEHQLGATWRDDLAIILSQAVVPEISQVQDVSEKIRKLERQRERLRADYDDEMMTLEDYRAQSRKLKAELDALQASTQTQPSAPMMAAATQLATIPDCWELARIHDDKTEMSTLAHAIFRFIAFDLDDHVIRGCAVYPEFVPAVRLTLPDYQPHQDWFWEKDNSIPTWLLN